MTNKLLSLLGLAKKAGRLSLGHDAVMEAIGKRKAVLVLLAADASERLEREMRRELAFQKSSATLIRINETMEDIGHALPHKVGVVSVNDSSFASAMTNIMEEADTNG
ncbi:MAG: ribosomal L7Ae/L30e/S12e/Gadd45 family protein [Clostridia bacterium]|nr:ribosomal L7Ae/L30e/S12e/Gadd45 family protein [Clostridia bacterium]